MPFFNLLSSLATPLWNVEGYSGLTSNRPTHQESTIQAPDWRDLSPACCAYGELSIPQLKALGDRIVGLQCLRDNVVAFPWDFFTDGRYFLAYRDQFGYVHAKILRCLFTMREPWLIVSSCKHLGDTINARGLIC